MLRIGLISDTHGLLRPQALAALRGSAHIVHAGDIGSAQILDALRQIAPLTAVRGNNDRDAWASSLPQTVEAELCGVRAHVLHDLHALAIAPRERDISVVISGHSHKPRVERRAGVLYVNPGSAGPRRFKLPVSVAELLIDGDRVAAENIGAIDARIIELPI